jgi:TIR domain
MKKIFLSHSYLDRDISTRIIEKLVVKIFNINKQSDIFFTGKRETGIESSINWRNRLKSNLQDCDIFIALITPNFKESEVCLAEIGAAWILEKKIYPLILPPIKHGNFSQVIAEIQADSLLEREDIQSFINSLQIQLKSLYGIDHKPEVNIEKAINVFLKSVKQYIYKNPNLFKSSSIVENKKQKKETIEEIEEILESADTELNSTEKHLIKEQSKIEWPNDYSMQEHFINQQLQALTDLKKLKNEVKEHPEKNTIIQRAIQEWPKDYTMQLYKATEEIKAYQRLN